MITNNLFYPTKTFIKLLRHTIFIRSGDLHFHFAITFVANKIINFTITFLLRIKLELIQDVLKNGVNNSFTVIHKSWYDWSHPEDNNIIYIYITKNVQTIIPKRRYQKHLEGGSLFFRGDTCHFQQYSNGSLTTSGSKSTKLTLVKSYSNINYYCLRVFVQS